MRSFITKLIKQQQVKLTTPSDDICEAYHKKAEESLISAKTLLNINNLNDATALTYFSMYHATLALLHKTGIKSENHTATATLLKELFEIENQQLKNAKKERVDKQYYIDFQTTRKEVEEGINNAEEYNSKIRQKTSTMQRKNIEQLREKFKKKYEEKTK